jgi:hypothetical protein
MTRKGGAAEQQRHQRRRQTQIERAAGERATALGGVGAVVRQVHQVVQEIDAGGAQAEGDEAEQGVPRGAEAGLMGGEHGRQEQQVLGPLMDPQGFGDQPGAGPGGERGAEDARGRAFGLHLRAQGSRRVHQDRLVGRAPDRPVGRRIAGVVELVEAEQRDELGGLGVALQVRLAIGGEDAVEEAEMGGYTFGHRRIGRGDQVDVPAVGAGLGGQGENVGVVGEGCGIQRVEPGHVLLEAGARGEGAREKAQEGQRRVGEDAQRVFDERVGEDGRAVEVEHERNHEECFASSGG